MAHRGLPHTPLIVTKGNIFSKHFIMLYMRGIFCNAEVSIWVYITVASHFCLITAVIYKFVAAIEVTMRQTKPNKINVTKQSIACASIAWVCCFGCSFFLLRFNLSKVISIFKLSARKGSLMDCRFGRT